MHVLGDTHGCPATRHVVSANMTLIMMLEGTASALALAGTARPHTPYPRIPLSPYPLIPLPWQALQDPEMDPLLKSDEFS